MGSEWRCLDHYYPILPRQASKVPGIVIVMRCVSVPVRQGILFEVPQTQKDITLTINSSGPLANLTLRGEGKNVCSWIDSVEYIEIGLHVATRTRLYQSGKASKG